MQHLSLKQKKHYAQLFMANGVEYAALDKFCAPGLVQNRVVSTTLMEILEAIYVCSGKIPVFHEENIRFEETKFPVAALPPFLKFNDCPVLSIPGHKKDREIFESFYPILDDNLGMYFRVSLAWLSCSENQRAAVLLHMSNRDFDTINHLKFYVPVITNMDTRMDIVAMSLDVLMLMINSQDRVSQIPKYYKYDPRGSNRTPTLTKEILPPRAVEQVAYIRKTLYPEFYNRMLEFVRNREMSPGAYTCGQFLLDLHMRN